MSAERATVLHGDCLVLLPTLAAASIDMVYLDPPFGTQRLWSGTAGSFDDRWQWGAAAAAGLADLRETCPLAAALLDVAPVNAGMRAYLVTMTRMLVALRRVLRPAGTLWLQCDDTARAYLRLTSDAVFRPQCFLGEVIWRRASAHAVANGFGRVHDTIFVYGRSRAARHRLARIGGAFCAGDPLLDFGVGGIAEDRLSPSATERVGYPTQKPVTLLRRLIATGTRPGDLVLDPTCGSGTTLVAGQALSRRVIGMDMSADAVAVARRRVDIGRADPQLDLFGAAA